MKIEIKSVTTGVEGDLTPDEAVAMAARGDYMEGSLVGTGIEEAMEGASRPLEEFIPELLRRGHFGPTEHVQFFFAVEDISRTAMAQVTRHRHMSFDVQSQRYANFSGKDPVIPPTLAETPVSRPNSKDNWGLVLERRWKTAVQDYDDAIEDGIPKEDARFFLPQATPVNLTFSANMRSLMHFFDLRNNMKAQWEARDFASRLLELVKEEAPITFEAYEKHLNNNSLRAP